VNTSRTKANDDRPSNRLKVVGAIAVVIAAAIAAGGLFYLFGRATPAAVSLDTASTATASPSTDTTAAPSAASDDASGGAATGDLTGTWSVDSSIGSFSDFTSSFVGYRVQEELANVGAATAVGRTPNVAGTLVLEGMTISSVEIEADLTTLQSDNDMRDGQLGRQGLETDTYPTSTFVLTESIELDALPAEGETVGVTATGDLTLHGVTKSVQIPLEAKLADGIVTVVGTLDIDFADYAIPTPQSMMVLSIDDQGVMELQLNLTRA
jgi:polyisoprenoid-binding protein YceI